METKRCGRCKEFKSLDSFHKSNQTKSGLDCYCKGCNSVLAKKCRLKRNKERPWMSHYLSAETRIKYPRRREKKYYEGKEFTITEEDIKNAWFRDKAYNLKQPSIDRIDNKIGYTPENIRFLELSINSYRAKKINQYDIYGKFIKTWNSVTEAAKAYNTSNSNLCSVAKGKSASARKYVWRYVC